MMDFQAMNEARDRITTALAEIEKAMTELDLLVLEAVTAFDMWSFIGQDIPMRTYVADPPVEEISVKRVPLVKHTDGKKVVIGVADVNLNSGVVKAELNPEYSELLALPNAAYSIREHWDPPIWDHDEIKAQLRKLVGVDLYHNPYVQQFDEMDKAHLVPKENNTTSLKMKIGGEWQDVFDHMPDNNLDEHPFFKEQ